MFITKASTEKFKGKKTNLQWDEDNSSQISVKKVAHFKSILAISITESLVRTYKFIVLCGEEQDYGVGLPGPNPSLTI